MDISNMSPLELADVARHYQEARDRLRAEVAALLAVAEAAERHVRRHEQPREMQGTTFLKLEAAVKAWRSLTTRKDEGYGT